MDFFDIGDCRLGYRSDGDGQALLLVHAGIADSRMWDPQVAEFARSFRVLRPDLRGYGETGKPAEPYAHYDDLRRLLAHLGVERAAVVGASMGGAAALDLCLEHPRLVGALVLVCSALGGCELEDPWLEEKANAADAAFESGDREKAARIEMETWLAGPGRSLDDVDQDVVRRLADMLLRSYALDADAEERELTPAAASRLGEIRVPTLVMVGAGDVADMRRIADRLASGIQGARKVVVESTAHLPSMERSTEFNRVVSEFLRDVIEW